MTASYRRLPIALAGLVLAAACGGSPKSPASPENPSTSPSTNTAPAPTPGGATVSGLVTSGAATGLAMPMSVGMPGVTVTVAGSDLRSTTDGAGHFSLTHVPAGHVELQFSGSVSGSVSLDDVAEQEAIEIEVHVQNGALEIEQDARENGPEDQLEGRVGTVNAGAHSFTIGQITVIVAGDATIRHGDRAMTFADLVAGARVHAKGTLSGSTFTTSQIEVQQSGDDNGNHGGTGGNDNSGGGNSGSGNGGSGNGNDDNGNDNNDANEVEFTGVVSALGGGCPAITFTAGGRSVQTTASTEFETPCSAIGNGVKVEVKGTSPTATGLVTATRVKKEN